MLTEPLADAEIAELRQAVKTANNIRQHGPWNALTRALDEIFERRARDPDHLAVMDIAHTDATVMRAWVGKVSAVLEELPPVARGNYVQIPRELYDRLRALLR